MVDLRSATAPAAEAVAQWYIANPTDLRQLRASLRQTLEEQLPRPSRERDDLLEHMTIVTTELATNALRHGQSPAIVRLNQSKSAFVLDVADDNLTALPHLTQKQPYQPGGRGLQITQQLALDTGWYRQGGRKHVWAAFTIPRRIRRPHAPHISIFDLTTFVRLLRRLQI